MSPFLKCRKAAAKAASFSLQLLGLEGLRRPTIPPERIELATRIREIDPVDTPVLGAISARPFSPEELQCDPYPAAQLHSMGQQSSGRPKFDPLQELETGKRRDALTKHDLDRAEAACATLARQGYTWNGGQYWKPPLGKPPAERAEDERVFPRAGGAARVLESLGWRWIAGRWVAPPPEPEKVDSSAEALERIAKALNLPVGHFFRPDGITLAPVAESQNDALNRVLKALGLPPAHFTPPKPLPEPAPGVADDLRDAIAFACDPHNPDALEWLRDWNEGDPVAQEELDGWRQRRANPEPFGCER